MSSLQAPQEGGIKLRNLMFKYHDSETMLLACIHILVIQIKFLDSNPVSTPRMAASTSQAVLTALRISS